ncbi:hypothetical protein MGH68_16745 [Erysipelothrix sp. D19-032]
MWRFLKPYKIKLIFAITFIFIAAVLTAERSRLRDSLQLNLQKMLRRFMPVLPVHTSSTILFGKLSLSYLQSILPMRVLVCCINTLLQLSIQSSVYDLRMVIKEKNGPLADSLL